MGTRHLIEVVADKKVKVAQYGQWDGYPSGQGLTIAKFLGSKKRISDLKKHIKEIREVTETEIDEINKDPDWKNKYPYLSRDCGANILEMIANNEVKFVLKDEDFKNDKLFCEYHYLINLDKETVRMNGGKSYKFADWIKFIKKYIKKNDE